MTYAQLSFTPGQFAVLMQVAGQVPSAVVDTIVEYCYQYAPRVIAQQVLDAAGLEHNCSDPASHGRVKITFSEAELAAILPYLPEKHPVTDSFNEALALINAKRMVDGLQEPT